MTGFMPMLGNIFVPRNFKYWAALEIALTPLLAMIQFVQDRNHDHRPAQTLTTAALIAVSLLRLVLAQAIEFKLMDHQYQNIPKPIIGKYRAWKLALGLLGCAAIIALALLKAGSVKVVSCLILETNLKRFAKDMMLFD